MDLNDLAHKVFGGPAQSAIPARAQQTTAIGTAAGDSADGMVPVYLDAKVYTDERNPDDTQAIMVPTTQDAREGDSVIVCIDGTGHSVVTGVIGGGDRTKADVKTVADSLAETDSKLATVRSDADAHEKEIAAVKQDIADYKATATATYATKTEVDSKTGAITKTLTADYTKTADLASTSAVKDAKAAGTDAQNALDAYKSNVSETYAEKTELTEAVNQLSSTMTSQYTAFTDYRKTNDTVLSKVQTDATNAQSTIDSYKTANDQAVADAKAAGTTAQDQLSAYKSSNDAAVADAKAAGTTAQSQLAGYKSATDQRLDELKNIADNAIESFYLEGAPTTSNEPASTWTTDALKKQHAGDLYMDTDTGYSYRWSGTEWVQVKDSDVTKALKEIESVKTTYATKSELTATDTELSGKVSDALTTAKAYTDSSISTEVTNRDAAIKAQADSISLSVSKTYTKSETFSAYQSDADSRIATANSNASTAVSTAKTAASDAATAKTNASSAVSTANSANTKSESAVSTANTAKQNADKAIAETKDLVTLRIDSSRGTVFKNSEVSTVLTVRCYKRGQELTTLTALRQAMSDSTARIRWYVLRDGDTDWVSLADSDPMLSNDGFTLTVTPDDVTVKCTFKAEIVTD